LGFLLLLGGAAHVLDLVEELPGPAVGGDVEEEHGPAQHPVQDGEGTVQRHSLLVLGRRTCVTKAMSAALPEYKLFGERPRRLKMDVCIN
jgi:hypothetical protein